MYADDSPFPPRIPRAPLERRAYAYLLDFVTIWLFSSLANGFVQLLIFAVGWVGLRIILVSANQGQSLGGWAFDLKVINLRLRRLPGILELSKREGILGGASYLAMLGLNVNFRNGITFLLLVAPLAADCALAIAEEGLNQAFHDRIAGTVVLASRRGFSLDLRIKGFWRDLKRKWTTRQRR
ncbi:MAG: RDD family protein [Synechocystis sp.]|nr:RDD family protein [Synechocystis sp.]